MQSAGVAFICFYLFSLTIDGVLRWLSHKYSVPVALYIRDFFPLFGIVLSIKVSINLKLHSLRKILILIFLFFLVWIFWGTLNGIPIFQGLFGIKTLMSIPTGIALWTLLRKHDKYFSYFCFLLSIIVTVGVFADVFIDFPWAGLTYQVGSLLVLGQREWNIDYVDRLGGFSRASFDAGMQIAILSAIIFGSSVRRGLKLIVIPLLATAVIITTSRASIFGFFIAAIGGLLLHKIPAYPLSSQSRRQSFCWDMFSQFSVWSSLLIVVSVFCLPNITNWIDNLSKGGVLDMASFATRTEQSWTEALNLLSGPVEWLLGLGIGGVGGAQMHFEPENFNPCDNLFIYTIVNFGVFGSFIVFMFFSISAFHLPAQSRVSTYALCLLVALNAAMLVTAVESPFVGVGIGLAIAEATSCRRLYISKTC